MNVEVSYRKEGSVVAILIIIIIIQWLGVRMKRKRKPGRKRSRARPMAAPQYAHLTHKRECGGGRLFCTGGMPGSLNASRLFTTERNWVKCVMRFGFFLPWLLVKSGNETIRPPSSP